MIVALNIEANLTDDDGEKERGQCWRFVRLSIKEVLGNTWYCPPVGADAKQAFEWYRERGLIIPKGAEPQVGDIGFILGDGHGPHGHCVARIYGNRIAENSYLHWTRQNKDGRGTRPLAAVKDVAGWMRVTVKPSKRGA
jgi:hypothetical protein